MTSISQSSSILPEQAIDEFLSRIERPARLLVAVSGGSDSTGLLISLWQKARSAGDVEVLAVTVDHGLRPEAAGEAEDVAALCRPYGIHHVIRRWEGEKPLSGVSAAARNARYRLLLDVTDELSATAILTGHTLDDQIETVAMRTARSDRDDNLGLAGMASAVVLDRRTWLLRPFLDVRRADIRTFLTGEGTAWIDDPSNLDSHYERVRTRLAIAGQAASIAMPDKAAIAEAAGRRASLSEAAARLAAHHLTIRHGVLAHLVPEALSAEPAVLRHLLAMLGAVLGGRAHGAKSVSMDKVMAMLALGEPGRITAGRVIFDRRRDGLFVVRENRDLSSLHVAPDVMTVWDGRYRIHNGLDREVIVGAEPADRDQAMALFPDAPPAVALRAMAVMPRLVILDDKGIEQVIAGQEETGAAKVVAEPILAPFDRFLPQFDLSLATEFAVLLGCDHFPRLPIKVSIRKS